MTDTGIRYTHCRGPHCGGEVFAHANESSRKDGLCWECWSKAESWAVPRGLGGLPIDSPEWSVAIDQWLEAGAP